MKLRLIRHATLRLEFGGRALLVDPCLDPAESWDPIEEILNPCRNPLVDLPLPAEEVVTGLDGVLVTHLHVDHWDATARRLIAPDLPIALHRDHTAPLIADGFRRLQAVDYRFREWLGIEIAATAGHHSNGPSREILAPVNGFILRAPGEPTLMIAGDSVWCPELEAELRHHRPEVVVVNAGGARQLDGERITMNADDVEAVLTTLPDATVVAVHQEAVGHCIESREDLRGALAAFGTRLLDPEDGSTVDLLEGH